MSQGYGYPGYGQQQPGQGPHQAGSGRQSPAYNPQPFPPTEGHGGMMPTVGLLVAAVGAVLALVSVLSLDFVSIESTGIISETVTEGLSFADLRDFEDAGAIEFNGRTGFYLQFTLIFALVAVAASVGGSLFEAVGRLGIALAALVLVLHVGAAFMWDTAPEESIGPASGTWVGAAGYAALAVAPLIRMPLGGSRQSVTHL